MVTSPIKLEPTYENVNQDGTIPEAAPKSTAAFVAFDPNMMPEAGGVAFALLRGSRVENGKTFASEINLTGRGRNSLEALDNLIEGIKHAKEKYGLTAWREIASVPQHAPAPVAELPTGAPVSAPLPGAKPAVATPPSTTPVTTGQPEVLSFHADKLTITPRTDGKTEVCFWANDRKFADIKQVWTYERAVQYLQPLGAFTLEHVQKLAEYPINAIVLYGLSEKKNQAGNPYKNVIEIKPV
jgi:hypothetical protein